MKKTIRLMWDKVVFPLCWLAKKIVFPLRWSARKITRWHIAVRLFAPIILFCFLGLGAAVAIHFWPAIFWDVKMYNTAYADLQDENSWQKAFDAFTFLRGYSPNKNIRQASAYNMGTFLAESNNTQLLVIVEGMLEDAVWLDPYDEDAQENLEIVCKKLRALSASTPPSELDDIMKEKDVKPSSKQPREPKPGDPKYGRGGSGGAGY